MQTVATPLRHRRVPVASGLAALLVLTALVSLAVGARPIGVGAVWQALWAPGGTEEDVIVRGLRVPRTVLGIAVGLALGVAGALMQGHTRNPLADPGLLGVSSGAAFAVCLGVYAFGVASGTGAVWFALGGALVA